MQVCRCPLLRRLSRCSSIGAVLNFNRFVGMTHAYDRIVRKVARKAPWVGPSWRWIPNHLPWTDYPDAVSRLERMIALGNISAQDAHYVREWIENGFFIVRNCFERDEIDRLHNTVDALWDPHSVALGLGDLEIRDVRRSAEGACNAVRAAEIAKWEPSERREAQRYSRWRVHALHMHSADARRVLLNERIRKLVELVMGRTMEPFGSLTFGRGSSQRLHQDMAVFHVYPHNYLVGAWVALEDIHPDSGPLLYCPKSHRSEMYREFRNYPQDNLRTCSLEVDGRYHEHIELDSRNYERKTFLAKKGDVLVWHGMLYHGGAAIHDPSLTRKSFVIHYLARFADRTSEIIGPVNWT